MRYHDRSDAAEHLATALEHLRTTHPLVLAIPRGGVPLGAVIARRLHGDLDLVFAHKIGAPGNPELALGAVSVDGEVVVDATAVKSGFDPDDIRSLGEAELIRLRARVARLKHLCTNQDPRGRVVVIVDDGAATGATLVAAMRCIAKRQPARLVAAVPVASVEADRVLRAYADEVVVLLVPRDFRAVAEVYESFPQVEDAELPALMMRAPRATEQYGGHAAFM